MVRCHIGNFVESVTERQCGLVLLLSLSGPEVWGLLSDMKQALSAQLLFQKSLFLWFCPRTDALKACAISTLKGDRQQPLYLGVYRMDPITGNVAVYDYYSVSLECVLFYLQLFLTDIHPLQSDWRRSQRRSSQGGDESQHADVQVYSGHTGPGESV